MGMDLAPFDDYGRQVTVRAVAVLAGALFVANLIAWPFDHLFIDSAATLARFQWWRVTQDP